MADRVTSAQGGQNSALPGKQAPGRARIADMDEIEETGNDDDQAAGADAIKREV